MAFYELSPAYGRDYKNKAAVVKDFADGKDFQGDVSMRFRYCSIRDLKPGDTAMLRYKGLREVTPYLVKAKDLRHP